MTAEHRSCHYCGTTTAELRPYGPGGSWVCFPCVTSTPEQEQAAHAALGALLDANETLSPTGTTLATKDGPVPLDARLIDPAAEVVKDE